VESLRGPRPRAPRVNGGNRRDAGVEREDAGLSRRAAAGPALCRRRDGCRARPLADRVRGVSVMPRAPRAPTVPCRAPRAEDERHALRVRGAGVAVRAIARAGPARHPPGRRERLRRAYAVAGSSNGHAAPRGERRSRLARGEQVLGRDRASDAASARRRCRAPRPRAPSPRGRRPARSPRDPAALRGGEHAALAERSQNGEAGPGRGGTVLGPSEVHVPLRCSRELGRTAWAPRSVVTTVRGRRPSAAAAARSCFNSASVERP